MSAAIVDVGQVEARSVSLFDEVVGAEPEFVREKAIQLMRDTARAGAQVGDPADRSRLEAVLRFWAAHLRGVLDLLVIPPELFSFVGAPEGELKSVVPTEFKRLLFGRSQIVSRVKVEGLELEGRLEQQQIYDCEVYEGKLAGLEFRSESDVSRTAFVGCDMTGVRVIIPAHYQKDAPPVLRADRSRFENVDLSGAHFERTTFFAAAFRGIKTTGAPVTFSACDFVDAEFKDLTDCRILFKEGCNFQRAAFEDSDLGESTMENCTLDRAGFSEVNLGGLRLQGCSVEGVDFERARNIEKMQLAETDMTWAKLRSEQREALDLPDLDSEAAALRGIAIG